MLSLSVGQIVTLWCDWLNKSKFFLVIAANPTPLLFYINTEKPSFASTNPSVDAEQVLLLKQDHPGLDYDSWLDCGVICRRFTIESIDYQFRTRLASSRGMLHSKMKREIIRAVGAGERLTTKEQCLVCEAFE